MAYDASKLTLINTGKYRYRTRDSIATIQSGAYFTSYPGALGDYILIDDGTYNVVDTPNQTWMQVTYIDGSGNATARFSAQSVPRIDATATSDGTGTGTLVDPGVDFRVQITSSNANNIIILPNSVTGRVIRFTVGSNGFKLRSSSPSSIAIGGGTGASAQSTIPENCIGYIVRESFGWVGYTITGATLAAIPAAA